MIRIIIVFAITITIFIGCREASKPVINPIEFNLLTNSDLKYLYMFFGCIKDSALVDEISFLEIKSSMSQKMYFILGYFTNSGYGYL